MSTELLDREAVLAGPADAPVAFGGRLSAASLEWHYSQGMFPIPSADPDVATSLAELYADEVSAGLITILAGPDEPFALPWWSPDPRPVIPVDEIHFERRSRQFLKVPRVS